MRLSVLWHQNLMPPGPGSEPGALDPSLYRAVFGGAAANAGLLTVPWPPHQRQGFWERYLCQWRSLASVRGRLAWRALVPLRVPYPVEVEVDREDTAATNEGFIHPWGATFVITLRIDTSGADFASAAACLLELRSDPRFELNSGNAARKVRLDEVAATGLARLRQVADRAADGTTWEGFSVFNLIAAAGDPTSFDPSQAEAARFLHAATSFSPTWERDVLPKLEEVRVAGLHDSPANHVVYGERRARAIWSPSLFLPPIDAAPWRLTCHHRNLVLASMQTESLGRLAAETADRLETNVGLSSDHEAEAAWAGRKLGELYEGSPKTYRSGSAKAQISQNGWLAAINAVRQNAGLPKIP